MRKFNSAIDKRYLSIQLIPFNLTKNKTELNNDVKIILILINLY